jgi:putative ABC transport system permease protein
LAYSQNGVAVVLPQTLVVGVSRGLGALLALITALSALLWLLTVGVLALLFSMSANERLREFGVYRALGATRARLTAIILTESLLAGLAGSAAGAALLSLIYFSFERLIGASIDLPYLRPSFKALSPLFAGAFAVALAAPPLASLFSAVRIGRLAAHSVIREGV